MPIVLVFSDEVETTFPGNSTITDSAITNYGTTYAKDVIAGRNILVQSQDVGTSSATVSSHVYTRNTNDGTVSEMSRIRTLADATGEEASISIGLRRTVDGTTTIDNSFEVSGEQTTIIASEAGTTNETRMAVDYDGISFSRDDCSIYFGGNKEFRLKFSAGTGVNGSDELLIESQSSVEPGTYLTRQSFTNAD